MMNSDAQMERLSQALERIASAIENYNRQQQVNGIGRISNFWCQNKTGSTVGGGG
jgi:flagellar hook assembly protein FlgD